MVEGGLNMTRYECENQIIEKLKEIISVVKQYDTSKELYLSLAISGDDYMMVSNNYYENIESPINVSMINGRVIHYDN